MAMWISPDGTIHKEVLCKGIWGEKPSEGSRCTITITDSPLLEEFTNTVVTIGDNDGDLWRALDICLTTMVVGEKSKFKLMLNDSTISLVVQLVDLVVDGFIYEWDASKKFELALLHKEKGVKFFNTKDNKEAAFRFTKALKILSSIPIDVEGNFPSVDGVSLVDINKLKANLFNNLSSCYFRNEYWVMVKNLCKKVLHFDSNNVKALYKLGVAYENEKNYDKAKAAFCRVLELEPENKASAEHLGMVKTELKKADIKVNEMVKKMFSAAVKN